MIDARSVPICCDCITRSVVAVAEGAVEQDRQEDDRQAALEALADVDGVERDDDDLAEAPASSEITSR